MFWAFILITALALVFFKLGMYSVWVSILSGALQFAMLLIAILAIVFIWRRVFRPKLDQRRLLPGPQK